MPLGSDSTGATKWHIMLKTAGMLRLRPPMDGSRSLGALIGHALTSRDMLRRPRLSLLLPGNSRSLKLLNSSMSELISKK